MSRGKTNTGVSMKNLYPVILCGGSGTRLWPLSREQYPKQLLSLVEEHSLFQATLNRILKAEFNERDIMLMPPVVITNEVHRFLIAEQLRNLGVDNAAIILEPQAKNTAPALCLGAEYIQEQDPEGLMLVMPADHVIQNTDVFLDTIAGAVQQIEETQLYTFGIVPDRPETGYGYIKKGTPVSDSTYRLEEFVEKPDLTTAQIYLQSGEYAWNSGMFLFSARTWLAAVEKFSPAIVETVGKAYAAKQQDMDFIRIDEKAFSLSPSDSIDYAVMEKLKDSMQFQAFVVPMDAGWSDIGSWDSLWDITEKDEAGNVLKGDVLLEDTYNSMILSENRVVAGIGLEDVIVIDTPDAVLVADKKSAQSVKKIVNKLAELDRDEIITHRKVYRPWGSYESIDNGARFQVKRIVVKPGARLSLQMHHHRAEHWIVVTGTARVTRGEDSFLLSENQSTYIPLGVTHRLENPGTIPLEIIEVQSGSYLGEDDIVRFQDEYGRNAG